MTITLAEVPALVPHTPEWREWRRGGIGGSDAPVITGDDPFKTPLGLWLRKTGQLTDGDDEDDDRDDPRWWGRVLETALVQRFELNTGLHVIARQFCAEHHLDRWRRATVDGLVWDGDVKGPRARFDTSDALGLFESKSTSKIGDWRDGPPAYVQVQVQHNLDVTELEHAWVAVLFTAPVVHFKIYELDRDESVTRPLRDMEELFWQRVQNNDPPDAASSDLEDLKTAYRVAAGDAVELNPTTIEVIRELEVARRELHWQQRRVETAEAMLAAMLQQHTIGTIESVPAIEWRSYQRDYFDVDALRAQHPKLAGKFTAKRSHRRFYIPKSFSTIQEDETDGNE